MASKARFAQRPEQVAQGLEPEEVETLVGDLEPRLLRLAGLSTGAGRPRRVWRLINRNVVFLLHTLDELLDQFVELPFGLHSLDLFPQILVEHFVVHQRLFNRAPEFIESLFPLRHFVPHGILKPALQQVIRQRTEQVFHAHLAGGVGHVFGVADAFHKQLSAISFQLRKAHSPDS